MPHQSQPWALNSDGEHGGGSLRVVGAMGLVTALGLVVVALIAALGLGAPGGSRTVARPCPHPHGNLYNHPPAVVKACGYTVIPLRSTSRRADGGTNYKYSGNGYTVVEIRPPANFDPTTANNSELSAYGYPARPNDAAKVPAWKANVSKRKYSAPQKFLISSSRLRF